MLRYKQQGNADEALQHVCLCVLSFIAGFCKQQLWPLFHYVLPMSPSSTGRFNSELWQAYVKANKVRVWGCGVGVGGYMYSQHASKHQARGIEHSRGTFLSCLVTASHCMV